MRERRGGISDAIGAGVARSRPEQSFSLAALWRKRRHAVRTFAQRAGPPRTSLDISSR
jgi:hypothetical protein